MALRPWMIAAAATILVAATSVASAQSARDHAGHGGGVGRAEHWHGGSHSDFAHHGEGWRGGWHGGRGYGGFGFGFGFSPGWSYPYAAAPYATIPYAEDPNYAYGYPTPLPPGATDQNGQWLYCRPSNAYYPTVTSCPLPWEQGPA
jgi:hypothetical protein